MTEAQVAEMRERVEAAGLGGTPWEAYIVILERGSAFAPYMAVDGRIAQMLGEAKGAAVTVQTWVNLGDEAMPVSGEPGIVVPPGHALARVLTPRGVATGTARVPVGGPRPARETPVEVAETSAVGRALGFLGYGLIPGSGIASAEEMQRVLHKEAGDGQGEVKAQHGAAAIPEGHWAKDDKARKAWFAWLRDAAKQRGLKMDDTLYRDLLGDMFEVETTGGLPNDYGAVQKATLGWLEERAAVAEPEPEGA